LRRILCIEPHFNRVTCQGHICLLNWQSFAARYSDLQSNKVQSCDLFRHGMLDLQASVHFKKVELAISTQQKLNGASTAVVNRSRRFDRSLTHTLAELWCHDGAGRFLNHLLVSPLH